ncbi:Rne/Rng family ribonuclease [Curtobacterium flaccumfaciens]|nr:Rne/Rng family ribonuclease [Curtobacterium flaccumfaciens]
MTAKTASDCDRDDRDDQGGSRRRSRRRGSSADREAREPRDHQEPRRREPELITEPQRIKGSTRLEAKKQRRRDGRDAGRRRQVVSEDEFLARRESVDRQMIVRSSSSTIEIGVLEDGILAEHYITKSENVSLIGNVYLGKVQNVLPSMEAAFVDIGRGRNAVLYAGEVDWNSVDTSHGRRIEAALKPGDKVLVQVTKDPVGHKGARLTSQVSLPGRYLVYVPNGSMNGISRKLPDTERARLKKILKEVLPEHAGVIVRTAAEGATEEQLTRDVQRLTSQWEAIQKKVAGGQAPVMLHSEPDLLIKIVRDVFNEDFTKLIIDGEAAGGTIDEYLTAVAPDLKDRVVRYMTAPTPSRSSASTSRSTRRSTARSGCPPVVRSSSTAPEAMTVVDVNTGKFVGSGGNLEETVTKNNLEAAEEIVRQLRLRDIGGIIVVDFIDMVLEENRDLVLRRLVECLSRDRTKHQVAEITSLGLVQMTRKKIGVGLRESLDEVNAKINDNNADPGPSKGRRKGRGGNGNENGRSGNGGNGTGNSGSSGVLVERWVKPGAPDHRRREERVVPDRRLDPVARRAGGRGRRDRSRGAVLGGRIDQHGQCGRRAAHRFEAPSSGPWWARGRAADRARPGDHRGHRGTGGTRRRARRRTRGARAEGQCDEGQRPEGRRAERHRARGRERTEGEGPGPSSRELECHGDPDRQLGGDPGHPDRRSAQARAPRGRPGRRVPARLGAPGAP